MDGESFTTVKEFIGNQWDKEVVPILAEYIKVECQSPNFDTEWATNGLLEEAFKLLLDWVDKQDVPGMRKKYIEEKGKTPFLFLEVPGTDGAEETILMYGHMDKQPPLPPWEEGLGPYIPVIKDGKLYGRAGADDGYAVFAALGSIQALQKAGKPHGRIVIIIEACEESGSFDLPYYMELLKDDIKIPDLVVCLDSGALNYDQMWVTNSLRGVVIANLEVSLIYEGIHSGMGSGIIPSSFRVMRQLLTRIEDENTGEMVDIPSLRYEVPEEVKKTFPALDAMGPEAFTGDKPLNKGVKLTGTASELAVANTWKPTVSYTGVGGVPDMASAGNVLRPKTAMALSIRIPPCSDPDTVFNELKEILEKDPPYGATVSFTKVGAGPGWSAPPMDAWLSEICAKASTNAFNKPHGLMGIGGSIPFMGMLGEMYPKAQFVITGVLGPKSNAHGPNEFLEIEFGKGITCCVADIVLGHYNAKVAKK